MGEDFGIFGRLLQRAVRPFFGNSITINVLSNLPMFAGREITTARHTTPRSGGNVNSDLGNCAALERLTIAAPNMRRLLVEAASHCGEIMQLPST